MHTRWIYTQFLAIDGNFRLWMKDRGIRDIELSPGWSFYVDNSHYNAVLKTLPRSQVVSMVIFDIFLCTDEYELVRTIPVVLIMMPLCKRTAIDPRGERRQGWLPWSADDILLSVRAESGIFRKENGS